MHFPACWMFQCQHLPHVSMHSPHVALRYTDPATSYTDSTALRPIAAGVHAACIRLRFALAMEAARTAPLFATRLRVECRSECPATDEANPELSWVPVDGSGAEACLRSNSSPRMSLQDEWQATVDGNLHVFPTYGSTRTTTHHQRRSDEQTDEGFVLVTGPAEAAHGIFAAGRPLECAAQAAPCPADAGAAPAPTPPPAALPAHAVEQPIGAATHGARATPVGTPPPPGPAQGGRRLRGRWQTSYQIQAATSLALLEGAAGEPDLWDTGKV